MKEKLWKDLFAYFLHAFCHPYDNQNHFLRNQQVIVDKISWNNRSFCTNQLDKFCQITVSLLWNNSTYVLILSLCKIKAILAILMKRPFLIYKISTLSRCWINIFLLKFFPTIFCANKSEKLQNQRNFYFKDFILILYCIYSIHLYVHSVASV